ncbi:membrane protein AbrB duplication [Pseudomonas asplenii]|uniref:Membrane protein AbrB duplication n=1 Tax=Pseudomonas asplenii TaxID=53407 RepID=A0A0N0VIQ1_9PSED|nr:AbrB family transcriptional regulator [Pseudomonas fuscovaginae]KPA87890.1 membrane protein AbrB duplication [Pseudomonas fuscovaginae]
MSDSSRFSLSHWPRPLQWLALILLAGSAGQLLKHANLPAGQFIGPMLVAIGFGVSGARIRIHRQAFRLGQGCIGLLAAHSMTLAVLEAMADSWHLMLFATVLTVVLSSLVGLLMVRFGGIQASTAAWGTSPGAASAMVAMADDFGADGRVVATMQYVRVVCVVVIGALVSHVLEAPAGGEQHAMAAPQHGLDLLSLGLTLATAVLGVVLGARVPAGALLVPLLIGGALQLSGLLHITLPAWLLATAYGAIGCYVGLRFDRPTVLYVWKRLPVMILSAISLIALCAASAWLLAKWLGLDFLSVYLATSPGGLDTMAIIAVDTHSDVGLVLAMQTLRLLAVIFTGAYFARLVIRFARQA